MAACDLVAFRSSLAGGFEDQFRLDLRTRDWLALGIAQTPAAVAVSKRLNTALNRQGDFSCDRRSYQLPTTSVASGITCYRRRLLKSHMVSFAHRMIARERSATDLTDNCHLQQPTFFSPWWLTTSPVTAFLLLRQSNTNRGTPERCCCAASTES